MPQAAGAAAFRPGVVLVGYSSGQTAAVAADVANRDGVRESPGATPETRLVRVPRGVTVAQEIARLRHQRGVAYAVRDYLAHVSGPGYRSQHLPLGDGLELSCRL